jgi:hypothetical protein
MELYGNLKVNGLIEISSVPTSGSYTFPTQIGNIDEALAVSLDPMGGKHLQFKQANFNIITTNNSTLLSTYNDVVISGGVSVLKLPDAIVNDKKRYKLSNLSGSSVTISGSNLIDLSSSKVMINGDKIEVRAADSRWWVF